MRPERKILEDHREVALLRREQQLAIRDRVEWLPSCVRTDNRLVNSRVPISPTTVDTPAVVDMHVEQFARVRYR